MLEVINQSGSGVAVPPPGMISVDEPSGAGSAALRPRVGIYSRPQFIFKNKICISRKYLSLKVVYTPCISTVYLRR